MVVYVTLKTHCTKLDVLSAIDQPRPIFLADIPQQKLRFQELIGIDQFLYTNNLTCAILDALIDETHLIRDDEMCCVKIEITKNQ